MIFQNRRHAGELLAQELEKFKETNSIVLALPRGGAPIAAEVASALRLPLDVLMVRKIGYPFQPELAAGAICEEDDPVWNAPVLYQFGLEPDDLGRVVTQERERIQKQIALFRKFRSLPDVRGKQVIVVDDGLATGATMAAAVKYLRKKGAAKIIVAVPVAATSTANRLRKSVDEFITLNEREDLLSVGQWYRDFSQVTDDEVISLLRSETQEHSPLREIEIPIGQIQLKGDLVVPPASRALIIFAHGSGSSRKSPRNQQVASDLNRAGLATLLFDLLTDEEARKRTNVFDIELLSDRLVAVTKWLRQQPELSALPFGYFGASTGAGAALRAASKLTANDAVYAVVSRGGRPDLAGEDLRNVRAPTLLLVGGRDFGVIELNQWAQSFMSNCELSIVPGATHLFEESGTLEEVSKRATNWFCEHLTPEKERGLYEEDSTLVDAIKKSRIALRTEDDLEPLIQFIKDKRVVMLGESSHGTEEFYQMRSQISKRLIEEHGFKFIAVEGDWPDAYRLNKYIQKGEGGGAWNVLMKNHRWPTWMWANEPIVDLAEWMRSARSGRAGFYGLDVYSLFESIEEVVNYLKKNEPGLAKEVIRRYACFDPFEGDEISYARSLIKYPPGCEDEVLQNLQKLLELRVENWKQDGDELFSSQQNAWIVANAESYYRAMLEADARSWNVRDSHMMETLDRLLERAGEGAKAIVWAHNTHIGDYRATDMKAAGYVNIGGLARQSYGQENVALVGFGTYEGEVLAGKAWGGPEQRMPLPAAQEGSYEDYFHRVALMEKLNRFYLLLGDEAHSPLSRWLGQRAVGVVYDPRHERRGNYVPTELSKRYDAFVFVDKTHALKSLHAASVRGEFPETWPSGQ